MHTIAEKKLLMLKPEDIISNPNRPRKNFCQDDIDTLCKSVALHGVLQPLAVIRHTGRKYLLISGERRLLAAKTVGLRRVPCILHKADNITLSLYQLAENSASSPLGFLEEANALGNILQTSSITQSEIAIRLGITKQELNQKLRLLRLSPKIQSIISKNGLSLGIAKTLLKLPENDRGLVLEKIIAESLSETQAEEFADEILCGLHKHPLPIPPQKQPPAVRKASIGDVKLFANSLSKLLSTLQNAGIETKLKKQENEKYIEFKVKIIKNDTVTHNCNQLKIC